MVQNLDRAIVMVNPLLPLRTHLASRLPSLFTHKHRIIRFIPSTNAAFLSISVFKPQGTVSIYISNSFNRILGQMQSKRWENERKFWIGFENTENKTLWHSWRFFFFSFFFFGGKENERDNIVIRICFRLFFFIFLGNQTEGRLSLSALSVTQLLEVFNSRVFLWTAVELLPVWISWNFC